MQINSYRFADIQTSRAVVTCNSNVRLFTGDVKQYLHLFLLLDKNIVLTSEFSSKTIFKTAKSCELRRRRDRQYCLNLFPTQFPLFCGAKAT